MDADHAFHDDRARALRHDVADGVSVARLSDGVDALLADGYSSWDVFDELSPLLRGTARDDPVWRIAPVLDRLLHHWRRPGAMSAGMPE